MQGDADESYQSSDAIGSATQDVFSPSLSRVRPDGPAPPTRSPAHPHSAMDSATEPTERDPLLPSVRKVKKPWYRARPLWLAPFSVTASVIRGMTAAPRIEVFTQLSCNSVYGHDVYDHTNATALSFTNYNTTLFMDPSGNHASHHFNALDFRSAPSSEDTLEISMPHSATLDDDDDDEPDPRETPSQRCLQDAKVQAGAARLQMIMTTTMGVLSALTTGWWGHFGEMHGRTRVLAAATFGLFLTDLTFILVSTPHSPFAAHGHKLLIISPLLEGALGGWQTLQAGINAYVSDCTSDGSRAQIFSRFTGVSFLGLALGPTVGAFLITHPIFKLPASSSMHPGTHTVTSVFYVAAMCSFVNLLLALFVFPEPTKKAKASAQLRAVAEGDGVQQKQSHLAGFLAPFKLLAPQRVQRSNGTYTKDYRLTLLAATLVVFALSTGIFQIKYLYAEHTYGWGAERLSYYISAMGLARTLYLLAVLPLIVLAFKPKRAPPPAGASIAVAPGKKPPPTAAQLAKEMRFDFLLLRMCLLIDMVSHALVVLSPADSSATMFTMYTGLSSFGAGIDPAMQSLALCIMQANGEDNRGKLFGAFAMLRTVGQMIIGPMLFGLLYSATVATFPKAIFLAAGSFCFIAFVLICLVRPDAGVKPRRTLRRRDDLEVERGRSRVSKNIGAIGSPEGSGSSLAPGSR